MDIKALREKAGKTRAQVLAETGMSQAYLSRLENESGVRVGARYLPALAASLGVPAKILRPDLAEIFSEGAE